jgi:cytochrome c553
MKIIMQQIAVISCAITIPLIAACATPTVDKHSRNLAASCAACHGTNGRSNGGPPVLAGLEKSYFITQMMSMKSGTRPTTVMGKHAKGYSDEEIAMLADFYSAQKP